jgi:hypothetical protein
MSQVRGVTFVSGPDTKALAEGEELGSNLLHVNRRGAGSPSYTGPNIPFRQLAGAAGRPLGRSGGPNPPSLFPA